METMINPALLTYTDLIQEINLINAVMVECFLNGITPTDAEIAKRNALNAERIKRATTGEWNDHRENA